MKILFLTLILRCLQSDILIVGDMSASVHGYEAFIYSAFDEFQNKIDLSEQGIKIGFMTFNNTTQIHHLSADKIKIPFQEAEGQTFMHLALQEALNEFTVYGRPGVKKILILISDGEPDLPDETKIIAQQLQLIGVTICGVWVGQGNSKYMESISKVYVETDYENLLEQIIKLNECL